MNELISEWTSVQANSLELLDAPHRRDELDGFASQFEECLDKMYQYINDERALPLDNQLPIKQAEATVQKFEKELQLKQHLAILLAKESPIESQAEMNIALWRMQPYVYGLIRDESAKA